MKSSRSFTVRETRRDTNFKHEKSRLCKAQCFFRFVKIYIFQRYGKTGQIDFPEKRAANKVKYLLSVRQILRNFTEGNVRKFTVSIALSVLMLTPRPFSFKRARITWAFVLSPCAILKL